MGFFIKEQTNDDFCLYERLRVKRIIGAFLCLVVVLCVALSVFVTVPAGHTGVVTTFGRVSDNVIAEGFHMKAPWQRIIKMDNRIVKLEIQTEAFSSDLQAVSVCVAVNYRIDPSKSYQIFKNVGKGWEDVLIAPTTNEVMKSIMSKHTAEQSIINRVAVSSDLMSGLNEKLKDSGISVVDINIIDFDFSDTFVNAVEAKQVAEQKKLQAKIEQEQITMEKEAEAERRVIAAKAEADSIAMVAKAQADANRKLSSSVTDTLVEYQKIEKWDGKLPTVSGSSAIVDIREENSGQSGQTK